ncbi:MAG TPA: sigma-54 dependent transcriptional regulator [Ramlibacter sp.]|nr:sigma-54 dependent transcriptional regulator [Ramlibacter sp.]
MGHALIVDDDADAARMVAALVSAQGFTAETAHTLRDARRQLARLHPDVVLLDLQLPDGDGITLLREEPLIADSEVVLITGRPSLESSIEALRYGASDYLVKPVSAGQLQGTLSRVMRPSILRAEAQALMRDVDSDGRFAELVGRSPAMRRVYEQIARVAGTSVSVLINGESGTGKELAARSIHQLSRRRTKPFIAVNCGAISPHLMESEIFGHEKGSFTGADRQHFGFFERANGGTLFLDEITEMPASLQVKLLRVLENGTYMRVGSAVTQASDVRVITATNRDPREAVTTGALREDLFYRLNVFSLAMPPLRERMDDVPLLAAHFLREIGRREGEFKRTSNAATASLMARAWPGNVRELRNALQRAWVMADGSDLGHEWLNAAEPPALPAGDGRTLSVRIGTPLADIEREVILATYEMQGRNKEKTAAALGISLKTLYNRLKEYQG